MTAHTKYVMRGEINSPPYQNVSWAVWDTPDFTGASSGYTGLINIVVDYTVTDDVTSGGNTGNSPAPVIPEPPTPDVPKIGYVMKAIKALPPYEMVTWKVWDSPDFTGASSGFAIGELTDIVVDYTEVDQVNRGSQALPVVLIVDVGGDLSGSLPNPTVVGLQGNPISTTAPVSGQVLEWNGTSWAPGVVTGFTAGGDLDGDAVNQTVIGLQTRPISVAAPTLYKVLLWDGNFWTPSDLPFSGDLDGTNSLQEVIGLRTKNLASNLATIGSIQDGYILTWNNSANEWQALIAPDQFTGNGDLSGNATNQTVIGIRNTSLDAAITSIGASQDGYVLTWTNSNNQWEANPVREIQNIPVLAGTPGDGYVLTYSLAFNDWRAANVGTGSAILAGDVTGPNSSNVVVGIYGRPIDNNTPEDGYVLTWDDIDGYWHASPTAVTWDNDLLGSTNSHQYVVHLTGFTGGIAGVNYLCGMGDGIQTFILGNYSSAPGYTPDTIIWGTNGAAGGNDGGDLHLYGGDGVGGPTVNGGDVILAPGSIDAFVKINAQPGIVANAVASFGNGIITLGAINDQIVIDTGILIDSSTTVNIQGNNINITETGSAGVITIDSSSSFSGGSFASIVLKAPVAYGKYIALQSEISIENYIFGLTFKDNSIYDANVSHGLRTTGHGKNLIVKAQDVSAPASGFHGGNLILSSGGSLTSTAGVPGTVTIATGSSSGVGLQTTQAVISTTGLRLTSLAGFGTGTISVDNSGNLTWSPTFVPGITAGGDLSGTYPNPTVAKVKGTTITTAGGSLAGGAVLRVTGAATADWGAVDLADTDAVTGVLPKTNQQTQDLAGDVTGNTGASVVAKVNGITITGTPAVGSTLRATSTSAASWGQLDLADTDAVTGILPEGNQADQTMGGDVTGTTSVSVVEAIQGNPVEATTLGSTEDGYVLTWDNGDAEWQAKPTAPLVSFGGDLSGSNTSQTVEKVKGTVVTTAGGSLATGKVLRVTGVATADWGAVDLADTDAVTGILPKANQESQDLAGDVSGTTAASIVDKLKGKSLNTNIGTAGASQDGYVITWDDSSTSYKLLETASSFVVGGDLTGSSGSQTVIAVQNNAYKAETPGAPQDGYVPTWVQSNSRFEILPQSGGGGGSGVTTVGTINSQTKSANGLVIISTNIYAQTADATYPGLMSNTTQTIAGDKTLTGATTLSALGLGIVHSSSGGALTSSTIVDADVNASAAIVYTKLDLSGSIINNDVSSSAAIAVSKLAAGTAGQLLLNNATPVPTWTTVSGDVTISNSGVITVASVNGTSVPAAPNADEVLVAISSSVGDWAKIVNANVDSSAAITYGKLNLTGGIVNNDVNASAAIVYSKLNLTTSIVNGDVNASAAIVYSKLDLAGGIVNNDVNASAAIAGSKITPNFGSQALTAGQSVLGTTTAANTLAGSLTLTTRSIAGALTIDTTTKDYIILVDTSATRNITFPAPTNGRILIIKDIIGTCETNNITMVRNGSEKIDGIAASRVLNTNWGYWTFTSDGTDWFQIG